MGSTTPPRRSHDQKSQQQLSEQQHNSGLFGVDDVVGLGGHDHLTNEQLRQLLDQRNQEIRQLKLELESYKLALNNLGIERLQLDRHQRQQQQQADGRGRLSCPGEIISETLESLLGAAASSVDQRPASSRGDKLSERFDTTRLSKEISSRSYVVTKSGTVISGDGSGCIHTSIDSRERRRQSSAELADDSATSQLQEIIQDIEDIDIDSEIGKNRKRRRKPRKKTTTTTTTTDEEEEKEQQQDDNDDDDDVNDYVNDQGEIDCDDSNDGKEQCDDNDIITLERSQDDRGKRQDDDQGGAVPDDEDDDLITDGLLTSLTDAAISNLNQLAALQERCESQQQHSQAKPLSPEQQFQAATAAAAVAAKRNSTGGATTNVYSCHPDSILPVSSSSQPPATPPSSLANVATSSAASATANLKRDQESARVSFNLHQDPFLSTDHLVSNQQAAAHHHLLTSTLVMNPHSSIHQHQQQGNSHDLNRSDQSLASVVVAAAAAAAEAAAIGDHQSISHQTPAQQHQHQHQHPLPPTGHQQHSHQHQQSSRLITSATTSPDIYRLHRQQTLHQLAQQISPMSSLSHYSSSMMSPSPSNSLIGSQQSSGRRSGSKTSSSILSPIASPSYLRRQYLTDSTALQMLSPSPSPSSGLGSATGSAHMLAQLAAVQQHTNQHQLHQHHQHHSFAQQRSASALAGPITPSAPGGIQLGGASGQANSSSAVVSPLMTSKSSSQARLNNMQIRQKFGYLGSGRGQFNSPHGFCLGLNQEIVVADTNNHRVCIFDKDGTYITQFGSPGKEEGQLWNPRKVAILHRPTSGASLASSASSSGSSLGGGGPSQLHHISSAGRRGPSSASTFSNNFTSGGGIQSTGGGGGAVSSSSSAGAGGNQFASEPLYVVCDRGAERSRMQLFTKDGTFIKKIGIHYIDIVAGLAITQNGLIIVVDSVSPTVYIINAETGTLNGWFDCSGHMKEPSDIAVKSDIPGNEYFICDFKGHCVVVFSESGDYLRKIGHDGLTSYPNGIDISDDGDILVGDSHGNRFHVVVFDRNGNFVSQFECPHVKVSRCCGLKITREGYIVTLAKNNHHVLVLDTIHI